MIITYYLLLIFAHLCICVFLDYFQFISAIKIGSLVSYKCYHSTDLFYDDIFYAAISISLYISYHYISYHYQYHCVLWVFHFMGMFGLM